MNKLPVHIADAIQDISWAEELKKIAKANNLDSKKTELFEIETILVILGLELPKTYPENLAKIGLNDETVISIATAVEEGVIKPILKTAEEYLKEDTSIQETNEPSPVSIPNVIHNNLPMVEEGETTHTVEPLTNNPPPTTNSVPKTDGIQPTTHYEKGKDPYREPLI